MFIDDFIDCNEIFENVQINESKDINDENITIVFFIF